MTRMASTTPTPRVAARRVRTKRSPQLLDKKIGEKIRIRRVEMGMAQADLGAVLGVSFQQVQKYEKGTNRVGAGRMEEIAKTLDVPIGYFYGNSDAGRGEKEVQSLLSVDPRFSIRLLRAYTRLNLATQRHFVMLMESVAGIADLEQ